MLNEPLNKMLGGMLGKMLSNIADFFGGIRYITIGFFTASISLASCYGHEEGGQRLLEKSTIDPTDWESDQTPPSLTTEQTNTPIVRLLLSKGANANSQDNDEM